MSRLKFGLAATIAVAFSSAPVNATVLTADSGWQDDMVINAGAPSQNSEWTFTVTKSAILSVTDFFIAGDTYTISGDLTGVTHLFAGASTDVQATGPYGDAWDDASYSKIMLLVGPGTYTFSITGDGAGGGTPAGFGLRLDTSAVPEPASWALTVVAFGLAGVAMRRNKLRSTVVFARAV